MSLMEQAATEMHAAGERMSDAPNKLEEEPPPTRSERLLAQLVVEVQMLRGDVAEVVDIIRAVTR